MKRTLDTRRHNLIGRRSFASRAIALGFALLARPSFAGAQAAGNPLGNAGNEPLKPFDVSTVQPDIVLLMLFGGDNNLSAFVYEDLREMASGLRNDRMAVLGLTDLPNKPGAVVEVTQRGIRVVESWTDVDLAEPEITSRFLARALLTYPRARKALGLWDHGAGVFDEVQADETGPRAWRRRIHSRRSREDANRSYAARRLFFPKALLIDDPQTREKLFDDTSGAVLANETARRTLAPTLAAVGGAPLLEVIFSDTCLNGSIEALEEIGPLATSVVSSADLEPGDGWDYQRWLRGVTGALPATAEELARSAVEAMKEDYASRPEQHPVTLAAYRSRNTISGAFGALIAAAREGSFETFVFLDQARATTQGFGRSDTYDLRDFAQSVYRLAQPEDQRLRIATQGMMTALDEARIANCALGRSVAHSSGLSFWFPSSRARMNKVIKDYERLAFSRRSGWADYLKEFR